MSHLRITRSGREEERSWDLPRNGPCQYFHQSPRMSVSKYVCPCAMGWGGNEGNELSTGKYVFNIWLCLLGLRVQFFMAIQSNPFPSSFSQGNFLWRMYEIQGSEFSEGRAVSNRFTPGWRGDKNLTNTVLIHNKYIPFLWYCWIHAWTPCYEPDNLSLTMLS